MSVSNRGDWAEKKVKAYLEWWQAQDPRREFTRLVDTKAAGRIIKAAAADFEYFNLYTAKGLPEVLSLPINGLIEVKETAHDYRLGRERVSQLPRIRKREKCGGTSYVLVYHTGIKKWRGMDVPFLMADNDKGSWDMRKLPLFDTCDEALNSMSGAFPCIR